MTLLDAAKTLTKYLNERYTNWGFISIAPKSEHNYRDRLILWHYDVKFNPKLPNTSLSTKRKFWQGYPIEFEKAEPLKTNV